MEIDRVLPQKSSALGRRMRIVAAREHGVGSEQLRFIGTDPELFEAFYREQIEDLLRFVARRVGDRERAADLTAEIFLAAVTSAHRYRPRRGTPKAWLYGIARLVVANDRRARGREGERVERIRGHELLDEDDAARMDERLDAAADSRHLHAAMDRLSDAERAVLELVALDDLSVAEAAAAAGVRPVTARVRLHRARRKLRAELEHEIPADPNQEAGS
ncbi:MAG TPA: RNA polymerase sigma factor [Solirubrobacterales bacterium]|jgi:RNA polymerase sigma-70 factor (ECF subfamily)|nr:RNA polymerase sigma factor [Solirubrobacterales bacterium]